MWQHLFFYLARIKPTIFDIGLSTVNTVIDEQSVSFCQRSTAQSLILASHTVSMTEIQQPSSHEAQFNRLSTSNTKS